MANRPADLRARPIRVSEVCDLRWDDIDLPKRTIAVRRLKGSTDSVHYLERDELACLKQLHREQETESSYVFINDCGQAIWAHGRRQDDRVGR